MKNSYPPIGRLVEVENRHLHLFETGQGEPTVILESGGGGWSLDWHLVQTELAKFCRVCAYDRAGFGWSEPGPLPRTSQQMALELHAGLRAGGISGPYILVGASFGGHVVRLFADLYPDEVVGMVLVDARHADIDARMPPAWKKIESAGKGMYQGMLVAAKMGALKTVGKMMGSKADPPMLAKLPPAMREMYLEVGFQPGYFQANLDELAAVAESDRQVRESTALGNLPITVIRHGVPEMFASMPAEQAAKAEQVWQELQAELAGLANNNRTLVADHSGHRIQMDQPEIVVEAVREMAARIR